MRSSGNVFADLGLPDGGGTRQEDALGVADQIDWMTAKKLTQGTAATRLEVSQLKISAPRELADWDGDSLGPNPRPVGLSPHCCPTCVRPSTDAQGVAAEPKGTKSGGREVERTTLTVAGSCSECPGPRIEPVRGRPRGIFLPTTAFAAATTPDRTPGATRIWSLDFTFALSPARCREQRAGKLGRGRQVSTLSRRPDQRERIRRVARLSSVLQALHRQAPREVLLFHRL